MATNTHTEDLVITRNFNAPPEKVWRAWTEPVALKRWWGPQDFTAPTAKLDLKVGGKYLLCMRSPEGKDYWTTGEYREIKPPEKLVMTDCFADEKGNKTTAAAHGLKGDWPDETLETVTFEKQGKGTRMTLRQSGIPSGEMLDMCRQGWEGSFDKLADSLK
jgi:uncharacterized protein YndB with AHSA1/START domain